MNDVDTPAPSVSSVSSTRASSRLWSKTWCAPQDLANSIELGELPLLITRAAPSVRAPIWMARYPTPPAPPGM
jgi:hypothetical protein